MARICATPAFENSVLVCCGIPALSPIVMAFNIAFSGLGYPARTKFPNFILILSI
jgi:hypothetical protein